MSKIREHYRLRDLIERIEGTRDALEPAILKSGDIGVRRKCWTPFLFVVPRRPTMPGRFSNIRRKAHKKSPKISNVNDVITRMRDLGNVLRVQYRAGRRIYSLEPKGIEVEAAATTVIASGNVVPDGTSLFPDLPLPAQTYRFAD
jgi:hypothetical protein